ncbi:MAG: hypothetical protein MRK02_11205 [Candidatus Scalindua sp.]|nr:hypothetical protein [Candidatus Scalindua sp.]
MRKSKEELQEVRKTDIKETVFFMIRPAVKYNTLRGTGFLNLYTEQSVIKY